MSQLSTNTTDLRSILAQVNALPEAGSGGGSGGSAETCTVTMTSGWYVTPGSTTIKRYRPSAECIGYRNDAGEFVAKSFPQKSASSVPDDFSETITIKSGDIIALGVTGSATQACTGGVEFLGTMENTVSYTYTFMFTATSDGTIAIA